MERTVRPVAGAFDRRGLEGAFRRRSSIGSAFGKSLGANTAAPPITSPGISAASIKAAPATTAIPTATYCFIAGLACASGRMRVLAMSRVGKMSQAQQRRQRGANAGKRARFWPVSSLRRHSLACLPRYGLSGATSLPKP